MQVLRIRIIKIYEGQAQKPALEVSLGIGYGSEGINKKN